jgi:hypothetical protein
VAAAEAASVLGQGVETEQEANEVVREAEHEALKMSAWQHDEADAFDEDSTSGNGGYQPSDDESHEARDQVVACAKMNTR